MVQLSPGDGLPSETRAESVGFWILGSFPGANVEPGPAQGFFLVMLTEMYSEYPAARESIGCLGQISQRC